MTTNKIIPAILEYSEEAIERKIQEALTFATHLHIDIIDESFAEKTTLPNPSLFTPFKDLAFLELHMMVKDPKSLLKAYSDAGFKRFLGHIETLADPTSFIEETHDFEKEAFIAIDLPTPIEKVYLPLLPDGITIMGVKAGASGQPFTESIYEKIRTAKRQFPYLPLEIDGGVNSATIQKAHQCGASAFVASSAIFTTSSPTEAFRQLHQLLS